MTRISPRVAQDRADIFTAMHLRAEAQAWRGWLVERACILGLIALGMAAGYLAHDPMACADLVGRWIAPD